MKIIERRVALTDTAIGAAAAEVGGLFAEQEHRNGGLTFAYKLNIGGCCCCCKQVREFPQTHLPFLVTGQCKKCVYYYIVKVKSAIYIYI